jgi:membrane dipeptidase
MSRSLEWNVDFEQIHRDAVVFDGLVVSNWKRQVFEDMREGGITAANCTCSIWEGWEGTLKNLIRWNQWFEEHGDLIMRVRGTADIARAKVENKVGIVLGWQNTSGIEDQLGYLQIFRDLGVKVMQLTYNTQNLSGTGCRESRDGGLSDFGKDVVSEMNRLGILCDLSHVGPKTTEEVIIYSKKPVAFTHICPLGLKNHPRNKSDELIKMIADRNGFIGVTCYPWFLKRGNDSTLDDFVEAIEYVMNLVGEDCVGYGTDFTQGYGEDFLDYIGTDKGYGRRIVPQADVIFPPDLKTLKETPNITRTMVDRGWKTDQINKVIGANWVRFLAQAWNEKHALSAGTFA